MKKTHFLLITILFCCFCGPKQNEVERYVEDGIEVVLNHLEPYSSEDMKTLSLKKILTIDTEKEETAEFGITDIGLFDIDSEGNIFISNRMDKNRYLAVKMELNPDLSQTMSVILCSSPYLQGIRMNMKFECLISMETCSER